MDTKSLITVARLIDELGKIEGRTRLQKIVHLLSERFPADFRQAFTLHYFGPFSRELASEVEFLVAARILDEHLPAEGTTERFRYTIAGDQARNRMAVAHCNLAPELVDLARQLNQKDKTTLEALSTFVFLRSRLPKEAALLQREFVRVKQHLANRFDEAAALANELLPSQE